MENDFITFQKFESYDLVVPVIELLKENNIQFEVEENKLYYNPTSFDGNSMSEYNLKLKPDDFVKTESLLLDIAKKSIENDTEHYLNDFTDVELMEILLKPDEWSRTDYELSQIILKKRGKEVNPELIEALRKQRIEDLSKHEESHLAWVLAGYASSIAGGFLGIFIGVHLWTSKKTLPDGNRIFLFNKKDRQQGFFIFMVGIIFFIFWLWVTFMSH